MNSPVKLGTGKTTHVPAAAPPSLDLEGAWLVSLEHAARANDVADQDLGRLQAFIRRVCIAGEPPVSTGRALGWSPEKTRRLMRSRVYDDMRAAILAEHGQSLDQRITELAEVIHDTAYQGALRQNEIMRTSDDLPLVNKIAEASLDRVGLKAPEKKQTKVLIELSPETVALFAKAKADRLITKTIDLERDFAFATERPKLDDERAKDKIGTGYLPPPEPKP